MRTIDRTITYNDDYMSGEAKEVFVTFTDQHQYLAKDRCGMGGTTAYLNQRDVNLLILTSNRSQVTNKHSQRANYECLESYFVWGESEGKSDKFEDIRAAMEANDGGIVAMSVIDSFICLKEINPELYDFFKGIHIVVDEYHSLFKDRFRPVMKQLWLELPTWRVSIKVSTATPQPHFLDIPKGMDMEIIKIVSEREFKQYVLFTHEKKDYESFMCNELYNGRSVLNFANDFDIFNELKKTFGGAGGDSYTNIVQEATGKSLKNKLRRINVESEVYKNIDSIDNMIGIIPEELKSLEFAMSTEHKRLFNCSSAYLAGWDFTKKCSVAIVCDYSNFSYIMTWLDCIQGFGRGRMGFHSIMIYMKLPKPGVGGITRQKKLGGFIPFEPTDTEDLLKERLSYLNGDTYESIGKQIDLYNEFYTINPAERFRQFAEYGYHIVPWQSYQDPIKFKKFKFTEQIQQLMTHKFSDIEQVLFGDGQYQIHNIIYDNEGEEIKKMIGSISPNSVMYYNIAYLLMKYRPSYLLEMIQNDFDLKLSLRGFATEMRNYLLQFIDTEYHNISYDPYLAPVYDEDNHPTEHEVYQFVMLYTGCGFDEGNYTTPVQRQIRISVVMNDIKKYIPYVDNRNEKLKSVTSSYQKSIIDKTMIETICDNIIRRLANPRLKEDKDEEPVTLTKEERKYVRITVVRNLKPLIKWIYKHPPTQNRPLYINKTTKEGLHKKIRRAAIYFYTNGKGTYTPSYRDNRAFSPLTSLSRNLRIALPFKFTCYDIKACNPNILRELYDLDKAPSDYEMIENKFSLKDGEGKQFLNSAFNNCYISKDDAVRIYTLAGIPNDKANLIANDSVGIENKGKLYRKFTAVEERIIDEFLSNAISKYPANLNQSMFNRLHDSLVSPKFIVDGFDLPLNVGIYEFKQVDFNDLDDIQYEYEKIS